MSSNGVPGIAGSFVIDPIASDDPNVRWRIRTDSGWRSRDALGSGPTGWAQRDLVRA